MTMRKSQEMTIKLSEAREKLNSAIEKRNAIAFGEPVPPELLAEIDTATKLVMPIEIELRAAITKEDAEDSAAGIPKDAELREQDRLIAGTSIMDYLDEVLTGKEAKGKAHEARAALLGDEARERLIPFEFLLPPDDGIEHRADTVSPVDASVKVANYQASVLERVFARSIAARLLVSMPSVPVGQANFPVLTGGTTAAMVAVDTQHDAAAASFAGFTLEPVRLTARYLMRVEDVYKLRGFEQVLRRDLAAVMSDEMDNQIVNGDGTAPNVPGFYNELTAAGAEGAATTWSGMLGKYTGLVDGLNAYNMSDIRTVIGKETFGYAETLFRTGAQDNGPRASAGDYVRGKIGGYSVTSRIAAPVNNAGGQINIAALTSYPGRNAVAPVWKAFEVIRDNITQAGKGQIVLTALALWNFKILRETGFNLYRVRVA